MHIYRRFTTPIALSFDLDDTLYDNQPIIRKVESEMVNWLHQHHPISATMPLSAWQKVKFDLLIHHPSLKHDVTAWRQAQIEQGLIQLGYDDPSAKKAAKEGILHALWLRNQIDIPTSTHQLLATLQEKFPLVAITNGNVDVDKIGLGKYFKLVLKAGPDGRAKPYRDMFLTTISYLNLAPNQILHIGDHLISDVSGAKRCGITTCWVNNAAQDVISQQKLDTLPDMVINDINELLILT